MDDEKLVLRFQNGDETAFEALYEKYHKRLYDLAFRMSNSEADSKDALQDTFIEVYRSIQNLREPKYFSLWIRKILLSKIKKIFAKNKIISLPDHDYRLENVKENYQDFLPEENMRFYSDRITLQDFVNRLPYHYREVLLLTYFDGWKNQNIAEILDIPIGTVKSRLNMARKLLKQDIEAYELKNQVKLNFHEDVLAAALFISPVYFCKKQLHNVNAIWHASSIYWKIAISLVLTGTTILTAVSVMNQEPQNSAKTFDYNEPIVETVHFQPVELDGRAYLTPYQAYLGLKEYLHCGYEMQQAASADIDHIVPLYHALKAENGVYYHLLEKQGWVKKFEQVSNH